MEDTEKFGAGNGQFCCKYWNVPNGFRSLTNQGTLVASAVTGSIQWSTLSTAHWVVSAAWYSTLLFSLVSVVMAFYLSILFSNFAIHSDGNSILLKVLHKTKHQT